MNYEDPSPIQSMWEAADMISNKLEEIIFLLKQLVQISDLSLIEKDFSKDD